jgi:flagellar FliL protein
MANNSRLLVIVGIALAAVVLVAASVAGTLLLRPGETPETAAEAGDGAAPETRGDPHYLAVEVPPVNLGPDDPKRFLQLEFQLMSRDAKVTKAVETHMPAVRNELILLLSDQRSEELVTRDGKQALRQALRERVQSILMDNGVEGSIEEVYLTRLVMQ